MAQVDVKIYLPALNRLPNQDPSKPTLKLKPTHKSKPKSKSALKSKPTPKSKPTTKSKPTVKSKLTVKSKSTLKSKPTHKSSHIPSKIRLASQPESQVKKPDFQVEGKLSVDKNLKVDV